MSDASPNSPKQSKTMNRADDIILSPSKTSFKARLAHWNKKDNLTDAGTLDIARLGRKNEFVRLGAKKRYSANKFHGILPKKEGKQNGDGSPTGIDKLKQEKGSPDSSIPATPPLSESPLLMKKNDSPVKLLKSRKPKPLEQGNEANVEAPFALAKQRLRKVKSGARIRTKSVRAKPLKELMKEFTPPVIEKDAAAEKILRSALKKNFVFEKLADSAVEQLVKAFEVTSFYLDDQVIIQQGDEGDYFYVIKSGEVSFVVNGNKIGSATAGSSFGELALLYTCPRAATVKASGRTQLWRLEQTVFRYVLQSQTRESEAGKYKLLKNIDFFSQMENDDLKRCVKVMTPRRFDKDEFIVKKGDEGDAFYVIQSGQLKVTDISVGDTCYEDVTLGPGDFFGERALVKSEPRAANVVGVEAGQVFAIDRKTFETVCGSFVRLILKSQDKSRLSGLTVVKAAKLESDSISELSQYLGDEMYHKGKHIFVEGEKTSPALYMVREGRIQIRSSSGLEKTIMEGGYFGEDHLLADAKGILDSGDKIQAKYSATVLDERSVCGVLSLADCRKVFNTKSIKLPDKMLENDFSGMAEDIEDEFKNMVGRRSSRRSSVDMKSLRESLTRESVLGEGQFGEVWEVSCSLEEFTDSSKFALKIQSKSDTTRMTYSALEAIKRECAVLSTLDHPFIVDLVHHYEDEENFYMVMGLIRGGDLWAQIHRQDEDEEWISGFSEGQAKFYSLVIADTLDFMHRRQVAFRDLKPENVMIDGEGYPIIVDFGFAKVLKDGVTYTFCGTQQYLAPEIVTNGGHGFAVDHWALGVMIYEMVAGESPFWYEDIQDMQLFNDICKEEPFPLPDTCSDEVKDLVDRLLTKDPTKRIGSLAKGSREIKMHPWFQELDLALAREKKLPAPYVPPPK